MTRIPVRISKSELAYVRFAAKAASMPVSEWSIRTTLHAIKTRGELVETHQFDRVGDRIQEQTTFDAKPKSQDEIEALHDGATELGMRVSTMIRAACIIAAFKLVDQFPPSTEEKLSLPPRVMRRSACYPAKLATMVHETGVPAYYLPMMFKGTIIDIGLKCSPRADAVDNLIHTERVIDPILSALRAATAAWPDPAADTAFLAEFPEAAEPTFEITLTDDPTGFLCRRFDLSERVLLRAIAIYSLENQLRTRTNTSTKGEAKP